MFRIFRRSQGDEQAEAARSDTVIFASQFRDAICVEEGLPMPEGTLNQVGFIGRDPECRTPATNIFGRLPVEGSVRRYKVICFYTSDNEYRALAERLKSCLDRFEIEYEFEAIASLGAWEMNCAYKARFIRDRWASSDVPVVWLDADATVEADPHLFRLITADFAMHKWDGRTSDDQGWEFCSGTLYFGKTELARSLLDQWVARCEADPTLWDQIHLCSAWCDVSSIAPLKTVWLPRSYLQIADAPLFSDPVIKHWQASRASKADGRALNARHYAHTPEGIENRLHNRLWRTIEEGFWIAEGTAHIKPETGHEFPEGFDVGAALRESIGGMYPILEVGCGVGRVASLFSESEYLGVDINPSAIAHARRMLPNHRVRLTDHGIQYPDAPTALVYTVLLHVSDVAVVPLLKEIARGRERVVLAELMDTRWRRDGDPPVFNRNPEDYILMMAALGFRLAFYSKHGYVRYENQGLAQDTRITFLTFDRA